MVGSIDCQVCFWLPDAGPAASPLGPFRLGDAQAEALSEFLQVFACGEESAALWRSNIAGRRAAMIGWPHGPPISPAARST
jgi:hypothetical protein